MQFQCGSCGFFKQRTGLQKHLQTDHGIYITLTRAVHRVRDSKGKSIYNKDYKRKLSLYREYERDATFILTRHDPYVYSNRRYVCYNCDELKFKSLQQILRHLSQVHDIHISYIKGISKKRVFLGGI